MTHDPDHLRKNYFYERGMLYRRHDGKPVKTVENGRYVMMFTTKLDLRKLIWNYHYGDIPEGKEIVHLDEDSNDCYIESLRLVDREVCYE
jgi:hypothetical protein